MAKETTEIKDIDDTWDKLNYDELRDHVRIKKEKDLYRYCYLKDELNGYFAEVNYGKMLKLVREKKENGNGHSTKK